MKKLDNSCGIILVSRKSGQEDRFLIVQENAGHWGFPKGHPEFNETKKETAKRELFEEVGINNVEFLDFPALQEEYDYTWGENEYHKTVVYFIAYPKNDEVKINKTEINDYKWATYEEALGILTYGDTKQKVIKKAQEYLNMVK